MLIAWENLPEYMKREEIKPYYDELKKKKNSLFIKRGFDIIASLIMLIVLSPLMLGLSIAIKMDSHGGVFFRQKRVTQYGKIFYIHKFRTMVKNAESMGTQITVANDQRVTKIGEKIRNCRLDELPQLIDILAGNMSFVGTRPEVPKYVKEYTPEMLATLLLPAGVTSEASILYKDENNLLNNAKDTDEVYINEVLPEKMKYNLESLKTYSLAKDLFIMAKTVVAVIK